MGAALNFRLAQFVININLGFYKELFRNYKRPKFEVNSVICYFEALRVQISKSVQHESCSSRKNESNGRRIDLIGVRLEFLGPRQ